MSEAQGAADTADSTSSVYAIRSVERVVDVIELLASATEPVSLGHVAEAADLPRSSAFRYLATLESRGFAVREPDGHGYLLGPAFPRSADRRLETLIEVAQPLMAALVEEGGETVNLGVLSGTRVSYLAIVESHRQVRLAAKVGDRDYLHSTGLGKVIAASLPEAAVRHILKVEGMPSFTARTVTQIDDYLKQLAEVREQGYAVDDGENEIDGRCVAVPIPLPDLQVAVSLSAPASRLQPDQVPATANRLHQLADELASEFRKRIDAS